MKSIANRLIFLVCFKQKNELVYWIYDEYAITSIFKVRKLKILNGFRAYIYKGFGYMYGVKFDEIKVDDLNKFRTFNQFFTRELKDGSRLIQNETDLKTMCSPCDGRVLSLGLVDTLEKTMVNCVKGSDYRLDEFLFGVKGPAKIDDPKLAAKT